MKTTITWFDNAICRPAKSGEYITSNSGGWTIMNVPYSVKHGAWNALDYEESAPNAFDVEFWGVADELPKKEEEDEQS